MREDQGDAITRAAARLERLAEFWSGGEEWLARELSGDALRAIGADLHTVLAALREAREVLADIASWRLYPDEPGIILPASMSYKTYSQAALAAQAIARNHFDAARAAGGTNG